jgi:pantothenate kinase
MSNEFKGASISSSNFFHSSDSKDIILPNHEIFGSVRTAVDIGGSLAKIVYYTKTKTTSGGRLNFIKFETEKIDECINFLKQTMGSSIVKTSIMATGGGAHKYEQLLEKELGVKLVKMDEMECLIRGLNFLLMNIPCEAFSYNFKESSDLVKYEEVVFDAPRLFPYLLVNIGSGVSILKVTGENCFERVSGTSLGGGTLWGLLSLLTDAKDFDQMLELSKHGDNKNVDMLVGDIYGMGPGVFSMIVEYLLMVCL